ncbi:MAG: anti-sigma factor [Thermoanaerobaculia bacterium]
MSDDLEREDLSALGVLEEMADSAGQEDTAPVEPLPTDEAAEVLRRLYVEGLGLLAYHLLPAQPQPGTRALLLSHLIGDETQEVSPLLIGASHHAFVPAPTPAGSVATPRTPAPAPLPVEAKPVEADRATEAKRPQDAPTAYIPPARDGQARQAARRSRWPAALATIFALAAAGLGGWAAMLVSDVAYRDTQIKGLQEQLTEVDRLHRELAAAKAEVSALDQRHAFQTAPKTTIFALRPPPAGSLQPTARGHLFLSPDRRHWQVEVRGLKAEPEPQDYQLWFIVDGLPLSGGVFDARASQPALLAGDSLPAGTTAIAITLERKGGTASPTSPILLTADSSVQL